MQQQNKSSGSEERKEHRWEVHRQRVRRIRKQESWMTDIYQSLAIGLAEQLAAQHNARFLRLEIVTSLEQLPHLQTLRN